MSYEFTTTTHGKWILAGEHGVLRGNAALVFPVKQKRLTLSYQATETPFYCELSGENANPLRPALDKAINHGLTQLNRSIHQLTGKLTIDSNLPVGAGMGASAAVCVALTRWFVANQWLEDARVFEFAKNLEHLFHGQSSGLDIAGVSSTTGLYFKQGQFSPIQQAWTPCWYLSFCGHYGITANCVRQVQSMWQHEPLRAKALDEIMGQSVSDCLNGLGNYNEQSYATLARAFTRATTCFQEWGLINESLQQHMTQLHQAGATATKPTGSGDGGYVVSLWEKPPSPDSIEQLGLINPTTIPQTGNTTRLL